MPAQVEFHTGVDDPVGFACRLLRKAWAARARVLVTAPAATLAALDEALWTFEAQGFLPHLRLGGGDDALRARTPIWLAESPPPGERPRVLVNLGAAPPAAAGDFERVIEIVGADEAARAGGRARWRHYEGWGVKPRHHAAGAG
ncbi:MAG: DNA polymerase III subunit chi [Burkholderiales bacterium]|nr:DNA polymerase III subunit chi [Burkholderiales bacterium]